MPVLPCPPEGILMRDYKFWVYIMASKSGTLYIGITNDIVVRVFSAVATEAAILPP